MEKYGSIRNEMCGLALARCIILRAVGSCCTEIASSGFSGRLFEWRAAQQHDINLIAYT